MDYQNRPTLEHMDNAVLEQARMIFLTMLEAVRNMEIPVNGKDTYIKEVEDEIDSIDLELLSRGEY